MKTVLSLIAGAALIAAAVSFPISTLHAQQAVATPAGELPVGLRCIVTLDPRSEGPSKTGNEALKKTGLSPESTVEGSLASMGEDWLVLKDGTYEIWIPRDKVLFMRVSR